MSNNIFERSIGLIGQDNFDKIKSKTICVIGLGGVGGTAFETLLRSGFEKFVIIDKDIVSDSNLNRQILFAEQDIGSSKVFSAKKRGELINKYVNIETIKSDIKDLQLDKLLIDYRIDFVVDAIDDVPAKIMIAKFCQKCGVNLITSLGMANRIDPTKVEVKRLDKTTNDPLAKKMRYEIKKEGLDTSKIMAVCSNEEPKKDGTNLHSMMMVPSSAGLTIGYYVLKTIIEK